MTTSGKKQVMVRPTSDPDVFEYHIIKTRISDLPHAEFYQPIDTSDRQLFAGLGTVGTKIAQTLMASAQAEKIERISLLPESIRVRKSPTVSWTTANKAVITALQKSLDVQQLEVLQFNQFQRSRELVSA